MAAANARRLLLSQEDPASVSLAIPSRRSALWPPVCTGREHVGLCALGRRSSGGADDGRRKEGQDAARPGGARPPPGAEQRVPGVLERPHALLLRPRPASPRGTA